MVCESACGADRLPGRRFLWGACGRQGKCDPSADVQPHSDICGIFSAVCRVRLPDRGGKRLLGVPQRFSADRTGEACGV